MTLGVTLFAYIVAGICFILTLRGLSNPKTARRGNTFGMIGMAIAIITTIASPIVQSYAWIVAGIAVGGAVGAVIARKIQMTSLPQLVAAFHSLVGLAAVLVATAALLSPESYNIGTVGNISAGSLAEMSLGLAIGAITFSGSVIAFAKLQGMMTGNPLVFRGQHALNALLGITMVALVILFCLSEDYNLFFALAAVSFVLGFLLILPIGGADMPVVVSMLNSYSGWAAAGIGFTMENSLLVIVGALVGSSGAILSYIMCKGMNRSIFNVILGGFGGDSVAAGPAGSKEQRPVKAGFADDAAFIMKNASKVIVVPGYGMAVAQAQHALREMVDQLKAAGVDVKYAIHPVAGRMPGHMNVLLAEANVPYDEVFELEAINHEFSTADTVYVIGANDVTNPGAKTDLASPLYGMPILDVEKAKTVLFVKRTMSPGYAGVDNELFFRDNTMMLFGDAKKMTEAIVGAL